MLYSRQDLHLQPAVYKTDALTVAPREHLSLHCGTSWSRTTFYGFSVRRIHQVCQSSIRLRRLRDLNPWTPFLGPPVFKTGAINQTLPNLHLTCGKGRTRTYSALGQQIYSLPRLSNFAAFPNSLCLFSFDAAKEIWPTAVFFRSKKNLHFFFKKHPFFSKRIRKMHLFSS